MADLTTKFAGLKMRNPIGIAPLNRAIGYASDAKVQADWLMRFVDEGAGYIYTGNTRPARSSPSEKKPALKFLKVKCSGFAEREGLFVTGDVDACIHYLDSTLKTKIVPASEITSRGFDLRNTEDDLGMTLSRELSQYLLDFASSKN